jgi:hypothetical protein
MYNLTLGQNGHLSQKNQPKETHVFFMPNAFSQNIHPSSQCGQF